MLNRTLLLSALIVTSLSGCAPLIVGTAGAGVVEATSERGLGGFFTDSAIQGRINKRWFDADADISKRLDMTVNEGRVLITGQARDAEQKMTASRLCWEVEGVKEVINEASVEGSTDAGSYAKDVWISTKLRTFMTFDGDIAGRNYTIDTVKGVVYLMGYARNQQELDRVTTHASTIDGVSRVVSLARIGNVPSETSGN